MTVSAAANLVLGFDFGGTKTLVGLARVTDGELLQTARLLTRDYSGAPALVSAALAQARAWDREHPVAAIGAATVGVEREGVVALAPNLPGWSEAPLTAATLQAAFPGRSVAVANDVKAACLAEMRWGRLQGVPYGAYLNLGTGVALAFGQDGAVWQGAHGVSGEVAYLWESGQPGLAAGRAPLEERFGGPVMARLDDPAWASRVMELGWWVGQWLLLLDVERLVLGGGWAQRVMASVPAWQDAWRSYLPAVPDVRLSRWPDSAGLYGAVALAAKACR